MLKLDPNIRLWVVLPLTFMNVVLCIIKTFGGFIFSLGKKKGVKETRFSQTLMRANKLAENGNFIPKTAFESRRHFYTDFNGGYLNRFKENSDQNVPNMFNDPNIFMGMMKNNLLNLVIMIVFGSWINATMSGFIVARIPFTLSSGFKSMFQSGISGVYLDSSWVSSTSFYYLGLFGLDDLVSLLISKSEIEYNIQIRSAERCQPMQNKNKDIETTIDFLKTITHNYIIIK